jgi:hypothetical protein
VVGLHDLTGSLGYGDLQEGQAMSTEAATTLAAFVTVALFAALTVWHRGGRR